MYENRKFLSSNTDMGSVLLVVDSTILQNDCGSVVYGRGKDASCLVKSLLHIGIT